jgi:hypothetical protein
MKTVTVRAQQRWEYCVESRKTESSLIRTLNDLGQQGWDAIDVLYHKDLKGVMTWTAFLKRPSLGHGSAPGQQATTSVAAVATDQAPKPDDSQGFDLDGDEFQVKPE